MSQQVTINGKKFEPSAELARQFGYSLDYISRLAREGKVESTRVGRQWFVEPFSLKNFVEDVSRQKVINREQLRTERKLELSSHAKSMPKLSATKSASLAVAGTKKVNIRKFFDIASVVTGSTLVLVAGVLSAVVINQGDFHELYLSSSFSKVSNNFSLQRSSDVTAGALGSRIESENITPTQAPEVGRGEDLSGLVLFDDKKSNTDIERIRASFSDEVEVDFRGKDTGIITPVFKKNTGEDYQFLMVPINDAS